MIKANGELFIKNTDFKDDMVALYFSKDRPMQLDLALTTNHIHCEEWRLLKEVVLYTTSSSETEDLYFKLERDHPSVRFIRQVNFKEDLLEIVEGRKYVLFVVDDCIFTHDYSLKSATELLNHYPLLIGFSLRLGVNTTHCYPTGVENFLPVMGRVDGDKAVFSWAEVPNGDFAYPIEVSSSIYRLGDIRTMLSKNEYYNPHDLEWTMYLSLNKFSPLSSLGCFERSVAFCNPINKVDKENTINRSGKNPEYTIEALLKLYKEGYTIDPDEYEGLVSTGCHQEVELKFIKVGK